MNIYRKRFLLKMLLLFSAVAIGLGSLLYTQSLIRLLKNEEKKKVELWAEATRHLVNTSADSEDFTFLFSVIEDNKTIPVILTDERDTIITTRNLPVTVTKDRSELLRELNRMKERNEPIVINIGQGKKNYIYYRESAILRKLTVYPYFQLAIILLFIIAAYLAFSSSRLAEQNQVWVGLSKETAHQLGTPVSSLSAWVDLFETKYPEITEVKDLSVDIDRLTNVTERFSLIGSRPKFRESNISSIITGTVEYFKKRTASTVEFVFDQNGSSDITAPVNNVLFGWVLENLIKNSIDAMKGNGSLSINMKSAGNLIIIDVEDTGRGIPKKDFRNIFKPGFSTRERGWGLGLSLSKRIIEDYHKGKIFVKHSEPGKGTTMRLILKK